MRPTDTGRIGVNKTINLRLPCLGIQPRMRCVEALYLGVVETDHAGHVGCQLGLAGVVGPCIAVGHDSQREIIKQLGCIALLVTQDDELVEAVVALFEPVAVLIRGDLLPLLDTCNTAKACDFLQLFLTAEIVTNVMEIDLATGLCVRVLNQQGDGNRSAAAAAKYLATFLAGGFATGALVAAQMEHIEAGELIDQALAQTICGVGLKKSCIGDKSDDACITYAVTGPANGADIAVIQPFG
ncbi:hypothetical protein FQZ97_931240 [compost metagenome]